MPDHQPEPALPPDRPTPQDTDHDPVSTGGPQVDARHAQGVQIGEGNVQHIHMPLKHRPPRAVDGGQRPVPRRVFLSHTTELRELPESGSFIAAAEAAILAAGDAVMDMAYYTAHDAPPAQVDHDNVVAADVYLLVAGFHYGTPVRDRPELSYTEHEYETATQRGIPRLVFLLSEHAIGPGRLFRDPRHDGRQEGFRQRLREGGVTTREVTSPDDLKAAVLQALTELPRAQSPNAPIGRIWGIPARPVRFTGREDHLAQLRAALTTDKPAVVQAVHGMGGVGKTTLALHYAHRHASDYDIAWWIPAEQPDLIPNRLVTLAHALDLADPTDPAPVAVARLLGGLRGWDRWLLVFDNAEDPTALAPFLPSGDGHVLITSRNPGWDEVAAPVEIREFTRAESTDLIRIRLPGLADTDTDQLAEALGDLPLALDHATALLLDTGWTVPDYLDLLQGQTRRVLERRNTTSGYPTFVAAAWQVTIDQLADTHPAAVQLLTVAAWLAPEPIPLALYTDNPAVLPQPLATVVGDPLAWADLLALLRRRALARVSPGSVLLHRIPGALLRANSPVAQPEAGWNGPGRSGALGLRADQAVGRTGGLAGLAGVAAPRSRCDRYRSGTRCHRQRRRGLAAGPHGHLPVGTR